MKVKIDIRGRINQWETRSFLGFASDEDPNFHHIVEIESQYKKELRKKYGSVYPTLLRNFIAYLLLMQLKAI